MVRMVLRQRPQLLPAGRFLTERYHWQDTQGREITCNGKLAVLEENMEEAMRACRDSMDDALLMGCSQASVRTALHKMIDALTPTVKERS